MNIELTEKQLKDAAVEYMECCDSGKALKFANIIFNQLFYHTDQPLGHLANKILKKFVEGYDDDIDTQDLYSLRKTINKLNEIN